VQTLNHNPITDTLPFAGVGGGVGVERTNVAGAGETPDTNRLTQLTAARMRWAIVDGAINPLVVEVTNGALAAAGLTIASPQIEITRAVWGWIRAHVAFVSDETVLVDALGLEGELELLITPPVLLSMARPAGDCDDFTMLAGAMLLAAGIPRVEVTTVAADPTDHTRWSHVYLTATLGNGARVVMDCSHGEWFGWEAPQYYARRYWGGITAADAHGVRERRNNLNNTHNIKEPSHMRLTPRAGRPATPGTFPAPVGVGAIDWGALTTQITTGTFDVLKQVTQKPGQFIQTGGGVISSQVPGATPNPGGISIMTPAGNATVGGGSGITGTTILLGAAVIGAALLLGRR